MLIKTKIHKRKCPTCSELGYQCEMCTTDPLPELQVGQSIYWKDNRITTFKYNQGIHIGTIWEIDKEHCIIKLNEPVPPELQKEIDAAEAAYAIK